MYTYTAYSFRDLILAVTGKIIPPAKIAKKSEHIPTLIILFKSAFSSNENRITASHIFNVNNGTNTIPIVEIISTVPYSLVVRILVYKGTRKKLINFVPKLPNANIAVFFSKYFFLDVLIYFSRYSFVIFALPFLKEPQNASIYDNFNYMYNPRIYR